ncbi:MAG: M23 family metallopeptidase [Clostridia bacterium]|nr:M23 family metallopeptidase [Clostridia bacterium]
MKGFDKNKLKKQIVSGGIYIALAAAVVTVTLNGVNSIIGSKDYEIPKTDFELTDIDIKKPSYDIKQDSQGDKIFKQENSNMSNGNNDELKNNNLFNFTTPMSDIMQGNEGNDNAQINNHAYVSNDVEKVSSETIETPDVTVSGEPEGVEYPTEPEPATYGVYAKPADGYIDKEYSDDELIYSVTMGDYRTHNGVDITGDLGSSVRAINAGVITDIYFDEFYGHTITIDHGNGLEASYMNLSETLPAGIKTGTKVELGQVIGGIGNSASLECAEVSHLHLSLKSNGEYIDPREFLRNNY